MPENKRIVRFTDTNVIANGKMDAKPVDKRQIRGRKSHGPLHFPFRPVDSFLSDPPEAESKL